MKHTVIFSILAAFLMTGCGILGKTSAEERERIAAAVDNSLNNRQFTINVDTMIPLRGTSKTVTGGYCITVDGDSIDSYLPYVGQARNVPYGGGKVLTFKDTIDGYMDNGWNGDRREVMFSTNNDEDIITYDVTIFNNGTASIYVTCRNRDNISYRGNIVTESPAK